MNTIFIDELRKQDASKIAEWKSDKNLSAVILSKFSKTSIKEAESWIIKQTSDRNQRLFGIYLKDEKGIVNIVGISRLMYIDFEAKTTEFGFYIGDYKYRGLGIGTKSLNLTINHAFKVLKMNKIYLKVKEDNVNALRLYHNKGFKIEGILKEHYFDQSNVLNNNIILMSLFKY